MRKVKEEAYGCGGEDMQMIGVTEEEAEDKKRWKWMIHNGNPITGAAKRRGRQLFES